MELNSEIVTRIHWTHQSWPVREKAVHLLDPFGISDVNFSIFGFITEIETFENQAEKLKKLGTLKSGWITHFNAHLIFTYFVFFYLVLYISLGFIKTTETVIGMPKMPKTLLRNYFARKMSARRFHILLTLPKNVDRVGNKIPNRFGCRTVKYMYLSKMQRKRERE